MNCVAPASSPVSVCPSSARAFHGVWHLTWRRFVTPSQWLILAGSVSLLGGLSFIRIHYGQESDFLPWTAQFYLGFVLPVMAFLSGASAIRDEMRPGTADYVLTRPVRRTHVVVFKYLSHLACLQLFYLVVLVGLLALGVSLHVPEVISTGPRLLLTQVLTLASFTALGFFFGVLTERYLVLGMIYAAAVELAIGRIPTQLNQLSMTHQLSTLLPGLDPDISSLVSPAASAFSVISLLVVSIAIMVALCALVFSRREMIGAAGRAA